MFFKKHSKARSRVNKKPEKNVEQECLMWMRCMNWSVEVFEAKAQLVNGVWRKAGMSYGTVDCIGCMENGRAVYVEFKAPGKRSSFNAPKNFRQKNYLVDKIEHGAFGCVVDSSELLSQIYFHWYKLALENRENAKLYLVDSLPKKGP